ncbi:MAG TPA: SidA/IucD/PvdA family monooxygenase [Solirubrobacteraceae bacterium]|nr:SidA/IucD/PvdA family monooxygenase [Solirubrobacteraceae bacterium]
MSLETDLLVVGAGAKGTAIAMKVHVLNSLGLGPITLTLVEATGPAAAWRDGNGVTSSREILGITPSKDVGFPYQGRCSFGEAGEAIDRAAAAFSWQQYLIETGRYANWVDAGVPPVQRRVYGKYLAWVCSGATEGVTFVRGRVARVSLTPRADRWTVDVAGASGPSQYGCRAFVLTGPGVHRSISHDVDAASRVLDCDSGRMEIARAPIEESSDIAIVGGGESALSCLEFSRALRPDARLTIYTPSLPRSRAETFLENRVFSNPDQVDWASLSPQVRRDFINRGDRGVFGPDRVAPFGYDERCHFVIGQVEHVASARGGRGVRVDYASTKGSMTAEHDYVINCTGFDLLEQMRTLMPSPSRQEVERRIGPLWGTSPDELAIGRCLELQGLSPRLHLPGLAAMSQGPGFAILGSLGLMADRVLQPFMLDRENAARGLRSTGESPPPAARVA